MRVELLFPSKYLRAADFQGKAVTLRIKDVRLEEMQEANGTSKQKGIVRFHDTSKALVLNRTNALCIAAMFGPETDKWVNRRVTLHPAPFRDPFTGEASTAIRVRGSPDIAKDVTFDLRLPRKNPVPVVLRKTGAKANGKAPAPALAPEPAHDPVTGELPNEGSGLDPHLGEALPPDDVPPENEGVL